jgi:hypothetical protein
LKALSISEFLILKPNQFAQYDTVIIWRILVAQVLKMVEAGKYFYLFIDQQQ